MKIRTENLCKKFETWALKDINIGIKEGETLAILGSSGAGKTTLLRILNLLEKPTSGKVYFNGKESGSYSKGELTSIKRKMAMVIQGAPVFDMSVYDNIAWGLRIRGEDENSVAQKVKYVLALVGLQGYEKRNARTLSGGEAQRVAFAMATVFKPEVLLLDEPTANLDPINEGLIEDIITRINKMGITIVIATHKQKEAITLADRIAVIKEGRIVQIGTPNEIFYKPKSRFVAGFTGAKNIFGGRVVEKNRKIMVVKTADFNIETPLAQVNTGEEVHFCIRPEEIMILRQDIPLNKRHRNVFRGRILKTSPYGGALVRLYIKAKNTPFFADVPRHVVEKMELEEGKDVLFSLKFSSVRIIE